VETDNVMIDNINSILSMYSLNEQPFDKSWQEWTTHWWQWFLSIPKENHPAYDDTGEGWDINQKHPNVLFLAGTTGGKVERTITIPAGKAILFPVINFTTSYSENPGLNTEAEMILHAKSHIDDIVKKEAYIDGASLLISEKHRVQSPPFDFSFPVNNIYGIKDGSTRGVGDGYWIFLKPLSPGKHNIRTSSSCLSGRIQIDVNMELIVKG
jgi:hypothetical protein